MTDNQPANTRIQDGAVYQHLASLLGSTDDFEEQSAALLEFGTACLGVDNGHITRIEPKAGYWETIGTSDAEGEVPVGVVYDLETTYCRMSVEEDETVALHDAPAQGWADDPAYRKHELDTYLGTPFTIDDRTFGTVCFVSAEAHPRPFTAAERRFVECLATFVGRSLESKRQAEVIAEKEAIIATLGRVLRHNLSNDLNVIHGHAEMMADQADESGTSHLDTIESKAAGLARLAEKARRLQSIANTTSSRTTIQVDTLLARARTDVERSYPDAAVSVDSPAEVTVQALPYLERAVRELAENAAKHSGGTPVVDLSAAESSRTFTIRVADDGPGLPEDERQVLERGEETPLVHGSGLGLWLVHWIVSRHDGAVEVTCDESGTVVELTIPHATAKIPAGIDVPLPQS